MRIIVSVSRRIVELKRDAATWKRVDLADRFADARDSRRRRRRRCVSPRVTSVFVV